jgi:hypothetical protein
MAAALAHGGFARLGHDGLRVGAGALMLEHEKLLESSLQKFSLFELPRHLEMVPNGRPCFASVKSVSFLLLIHAFNPEFK